MIKLARSWSGHTDPKVKLMRRADTEASSRYGNGNQLKTRTPPARITLPRLKFMEPK